MNYSSATVTTHEGPITYDLSDFNDIITKIPPHRINACLEELKPVLTSLALGFQRVKGLGIFPPEVGNPLALPLMKWTDDEKDDVSIALYEPLPEGDFAKMVDQIRKDQAAGKYPPVPPLPADYVPGPIAARVAEKLDRAFEELAEIEGVELHPVQDQVIVETPADKAEEVARKLHMVFMKRGQIVGTD